MSTVLLCVCGLTGIHLEDVELTKRPFYIGWGSLNRAEMTIVRYRVICVAQLHGQNQPSIIPASLQRGLDSSTHCMGHNIKHSDLRLLLKEWNLPSI